MGNIKEKISSKKACVKYKIYNMYAQFMQKSIDSSVNTEKLLRSKGYSELADKVASGRATCEKELAYANLKMCGLEFRALRKIMQFCEDNNIEWK